MKEKIKEFLKWANNWDGWSYFIVVFLIPFLIWMFFPFLK